MDRIEDQGDSIPIGPHGAIITLIADDKEPANRLYEIAGPDRDDGVTLTGEELAGLATQWSRDKDRTARKMKDCPRCGMNRPQGATCHACGLQGGDA